MKTVEPLKPDYSGPNVMNVVPAVLGVRPVEWLPEPVAGARAVVLLVLDGLGWEARTRHAALLPELSALDGRAITTVIPSTTPAALTSITTGLPPGRHGITGFRIRVDHSVLNAIRWQQENGKRPPEPADMQRHAPFADRQVAVVTKSEFRRSGFTGVHLRGADFHGWPTTAVLVEHVRALGRGRRAVRVRVLPGRRRGRALVRARRAASTPLSSRRPIGSSAPSATCCPETPRCWSPPTTGRSTSDRSRGSGSARSTA